MTAHALAPGRLVVPVSTQLITLKKIVQQLAMADSRQEQVQTVVQAIVDAVHVDVCSLYLLEGEDMLVLAATVGLDPRSVGQVRLRLGEGLVGQVAESLHPLNIDNAETSPYYRYFPETGEERFHAFLGVPLVHLGEVSGVLVVQDTLQRRFTEDEEAFLITIASQLALVVSSGQLSAREAIAAGKGSYRVAGVRGAPGIGIGKVYLLRSGELSGVTDKPAEDVEAELAQFDNLVALTRAQLEQEEQSFTAGFPAEIAALFSVYRSLLEDRQLRAHVEAQIRQGHWLPAALKRTIAHYCGLFDAMDDPYLRARREDMIALGDKLYANWRGTHPTPVEQDGPVVLMGDLVTITDIARFGAEQLAGIVGFSGSALSHSAVLANAIGVPAVMGAGKLPDIANGRLVIVDGHQGQLIINPPESVVAEFQVLRNSEQALIADLERLKDQPAETPDGHRIRLYANSGLLADISPGLRRGAEGIGLYRTEIPFMVHDSFPPEDEQYRVYRHVLEAYDGKPVYMRTLDIGGDKALPYFPIREDNPFLGWRGIRFTLANSSIFITQLRAMLRADVGLGNLHILVPMVSRTDEVNGFLELLEDACQQLFDEGFAVRRPPVGVMVEVPVAIPQLKFWASRIDFVSIGSNDLAQYLLAVDRNNARVSSLFDHVHPGVLHEVYHIVREAARLELPLCLCGEMASDPVAAVLLLGMGVESLSMSAYNLPKIKWLLRSITASHAQHILHQALQLDDEHAIRALVQGEIKAAGLGNIFPDYQRQSTVASVPEVR